MLTDSGAAARILTPDEIMNGKGTGWIEHWFEADEESPEYKDMIECAWVHGFVLEDDGDGGVIFPERLKKRHNRQYEFRVWSDRPDDATREKVKWDA